MTKALMWGLGCVLLAVPAAAATPDCQDLAPSSAPVPAELFERCAAPAERAPGVAAPTDLAVGVDALGAPDLVSFPLGSPDLFATIGPTGAPSGQPIVGCDFDGSGNFDTLVCVDNGQPADLLAVDAATGAVGVLGSIEAEAGEYFTSVSTDPVTGSIYLTSANCTTESSHLYVVDASTAMLTRIGDGPTGAACLLSSGIDRRGRIFAVEARDDVLVRLDRETGASTVIGALGFDANFAQGMDFDEGDGTCYLFAFNQDNEIGMRAELRTCNPRTGATTFVGTLGATTPGGSTEITGAGIAWTRGGCGGGAGAVGASSSAGAGAPWLLALAMGLGRVRRRRRRAARRAVGY